MRGATVVVVAALLAGCCPEPHAARAATPIKSACTASSRAPASVGLDVRPGRKHSDARTLSVTNVGDVARTVRVDDISRLEGACSAEWSRTTALVFTDVATGAPPASRTLRPGEHLELTIGPQVVAATWDCVKLGLAVKLSVDATDGRGAGEQVCADGGSWIASRDDDE